MATQSVITGEVTAFSWSSFGELVIEFGDKQTLTFHQHSSTTYRLTVGDDTYGPCSTIRGELYDKLTMHFMPDSKCTIDIVSDTEVCFVMKCADFTFGGWPWVTIELVVSCDASDGSVCSIV